MPIYEYRCESCGHELEAIQKISDAPLVSCPVCEKDSLKKKISAAGFRLKGGGWYETDFKSGKKRNVAGEDTGSSSAAAATSGTDTKSESKAESKTDSKKTDTKSGGTSGTKAD